MFLNLQPRNHPKNLAKDFSRCGLLALLCGAVLFSAGCHSSNSTGDPHILWTFSAGPNPLSGIALSPNGNLHFAADDGIYALSPSGKLLWKSPLPTGPVYSAPAISPEGTLFAASKSGHLFALDSSGNLTWQSSATGSRFFTSPSLGNTGAVYAADEFSNIFSFTPTQSTGIAWQQSTFTPGTPSDQVLLGNNRVYNEAVWRTSPAIGPDETIFLAHQQFLYLLNSHGDVMWFLQLPIGQLGFLAIGANGAVYVSGFNSPELFAVGFDGKMLWQIRTSNRLQGSVVLDTAGVLYFCDSDFVKAVLPEGQSKWYTQADCNSGPALAADGTLYVGTLSRTRGSNTRASFLSAFSSEGQLKWQTEIRGIVRDAPAIASDGTIFFTTDKGFVYALKDTGSPLIDSPWPRFQHDAQNSSRSAIAH